MTYSNSSCRVYNPPVRIKRRFEGWCLVQWQDNGGEGHVPAGEIE